MTTGPRLTREDLERKVDTLSQEIERGGGDAEAYHDRGNALSNLGEYPRAAADYRRALALRPSDAVLLNNLGMALLCSGEFAAALQRLDEAVAACPSYRDAHHNRGLARAELGDVEGAIADMTRAIELDPEFWSAYRHRAILHSMAGNHRESYADYLRTRPVTGILRRVRRRRLCLPVTLGGKGRERRSVAGRYVASAMPEWRPGAAIRSYSAISPCCRRAPRTARLPQSGSMRIASRVISFSLSLGHPAYSSR